MRAFATRARTAPLLIALALAATAPAAAAPAPGEPAAAKPFERRLHSFGVGASSFLSNDSNKFLENHHPNYVADDDPATAWIEGAKSSGKGEWLRFSLGLRNEISRVRLRVRNGCQKSKDVWKANARAKEVTVRILGAEKDHEKKVALTDTDGWQEIVVDMPTGPLEAVELAIDSVYEGTRTTDLCISDVQVFTTSTERDQPELEKRALADLMKWRSARIAAAKMFAALPAGYPLYPSFDVQQYTQAPKGCGTDVAWVARTQPKEGPSRVAAIAIGRCARVVGRGGPQIATSVEIMIYDPTGKLVLVSGAGRLDCYRWTP